MKQALVLIGTAVLLSGNLFADPIIVKERALELRNQNNVRQGIAQPAPPPPAAQLATTPAAQASPTPIQQSVAKLRASLTAIKADSLVTAEQKQQIGRDLMALAQGAHKPSAATAANLADGLVSAFATKPLPEKDCRRLLSDLAAVFNPAKIQPAQMQAIYADIQAIFQANGMVRREAVKLADQVKAVGVETQKTGG